MSKSMTRRRNRTTRKNRNTRKNRKNRNTRKNRRQSGGVPEWLKKLMGKKEPATAQTMEQLNTAIAREAKLRLNSNLDKGANASRPELMGMLRTAVRTGAVPKNLTRSSKYTLYIYSNVMPVKINLTNSSGFNRNSEPLTITKITPSSILNNQVEIVRPVPNNKGISQTLVRLKTNVNVYYKIPETHFLTNKYDSVLVTLNSRDGIYGISQEDNGSMVLMVWVYVDLEVLDGKSVLKWDAMSDTIERLNTTYLIPKGGGASSKVELKEAILRNISNNSKKSLAVYEEVERRRTGSTILPTDPEQEEFNEYVGIRNEELEE